MTSGGQNARIPHRERSAREVLSKPLNAAWAVLCFTGALALSGYISTNEIGPPWFWASDACPGRDGVCGMVPGGVLLSICAGTILITVGIGLLEQWRATNDQ